MRVADADVPRSAIPSDAPCSFLVADIRTTVTAAVVALVVAEGASGVIPTVAGRELSSWAFLALAAIGVALRVRGQVDASRVVTPVEQGAALMLLGGLGAVVTNSGLGGDGLVRMAGHVSILVAIASLSARAQSVRMVLAGLVLGIGLQVAVALVELFRGTTFLYSLWKPVDAANWVGFARVASTPADPNYLALGLVSTLPIVLTLRELSPKLGPRIIVILACSWLLTIAFTFSRAGYLGLGALPFIMLVLRGGIGSGVGRLRHRLRQSWRRLAVLSVFISLAAVLFLFWPGSPIGAMVLRLESLSLLTKDASLNVRSAAQLAAAIVFAQHPLFGIGFDRFVTAGAATFDAIAGLHYQEINVLDSFLLVACEGGIVALFGFLVATVATFRSFIRCGWAVGLTDVTGPRHTQMPYALATGVLIWSLMSLTLDGVHSPIQWVLFGLGALLWRVARLRPVAQ